SIGKLFTRRHLYLLILLHLMAKFLGALLSQQGARRANIIWANKVALGAQSLFSGRQTIRSAPRSSPLGVGSAAVGTKPK
ncbi:hypothetical protein ACW5W4_18465, partial [Aeromonas crassostreae]